MRSIPDQYYCCRLWPLAAIRAVRRGNLLEHRHPLARSGRPRARAVSEAVERVRWQRGSKLRVDQGRRGRSGRGGSWGRRRRGTVRRQADGQPGDDRNDSLSQDHDDNDLPLSPDPLAFLLPLAGGPFLPPTPRPRGAAGGADPTSDGSLPACTRRAPGRDGKGASSDGRRDGSPRALQAPLARCRGPLPGPGPRPAARTRRATDHDSQGTQSICELSLRCLSSACITKRWAQGTATTPRLTAWQRVDRVHRLATARGRQSVESGNPSGGRNVAVVSRWARAAQQTVRPRHVSSRIRPAAEILTSIVAQRGLGRGAHTGVA
jgi:hypothetical protein